jgi:hypothetical protein
MARMVSRPRYREGRGLGERLSEVIVFIVIAVGIALAVRWYLFIYLRAPGTALGNFVAATKAGNVEGQYQLLASSTKMLFPSRKEYTEKWKMAQGVAGRLTTYTIRNVVETGDKATADVTVAIRKAGQELIQIDADTFSDRYVLQREPDGWKVVLEASKLESQKAVSDLR